MYEYFDPNPARSGAIDCSTRALAKALDISWERAYVIKSLNGFLMGNEGVADEVWGSVLRQHGFKRKMVPDACPDCYTVDMFCEDNPRGTFVIKSEDHVATVKDGTLYDSWPSGGKSVIYYWYKADEREDDQKRTE